MIRIALRQQRASIIGFTLFGALIGAGQGAAFLQLAGATAAERAVFAAQMEPLARQLLFMLPTLERADTLGGYLQWRMVGALPLVFGIWAVLSAAGAARGDEERGLTEAWLANGASRARILVSHALVFLGGLTLACTAAVAGADVIARAEPLPLAAMIGTVVTTVGIVGACYALTTVVAQFLPTRGAAASAAGALVATLYFANGIARAAGGSRGLVGVIDPFAWYDLSAPLVPGRGTDLAGTLALGALGLVALALGVHLASGRDVGATALPQRPDPPRSPVLEPSRDPLLRSFVGAGLRAQAGSLLTWALALSVLAVFMGSIARTTVDALRNIPGLSGYLQMFGGGDPYQAFFGFTLFTILALAVAGYAITLVGAWAADDGEGRLEMVLAAGVPRPAIVAARAVQCLIAMVALAVTAGLAGLAGAVLAGISLDPGQLALASLLLVPLGAAFAGIGALVIAVRPRLGVPALAAAALWSYFAEQFGPLFRLDWVTQASLFQLYGAPLATGVEWSGEVWLAAIGAGGFGIAALLMERRDVGT